MLLMIWHVMDLYFGSVICIICYLLFTCDHINLEEIGHKDRGGGYPLYKHMCRRERGWVGTLYFLLTAKTLQPAIFRSCMLQ